MNRRRLRGIVVHGLVWPLVTLAVVAGGATLVGASPGLAVLTLSMGAAAGSAGLLLSQTREMEPDDDPVGGATGRDERTAVGLRSALSGGTDPDGRSGVPRGRVVVTRYASGLFVVSALAVLYLGGLFG
ncbi:hypothetical protein RYH80_07945 [Halobaculum sp. MBLA0147]|uniref:hypothetical protein n=1 Tax=Halobaculum sp. MBLA0147 TaxID=3079934 RepID=UPI003523180F